MNTIKPIDYAREVMEAYCDCGDLPFEQTVKRRNLNFRSSVWLTPEEAQKIMNVAVPNGYNAFEAQLIGALPGTVKVQIAREGSVCLYVDTTGARPDEMKAALAVMQPDESDMEIEDIWRLWWD